MGMAEDPATGGVTEEQAAEALRKLVDLHQDSDNDDDEPFVVSQVEQPAADTTAETTDTPPAEEPTEEPAPVAADAAPESVESDDVASLKQRTKDLEERLAEADKRAQARIEAIKQRESQSGRILRERMLRKSTVADKALKILRQSRSSEGVPESEVDRLISEIESTMNPASANYAPPEQYQQQHGGGAASEDQVLVLNDFLNERGMTSEEAEEFGKWIRNEAATTMSPTEQAVAQESLNGFLHLAHARWNEVLQRKQQQTKADAVSAVKSVQRTQREVARAAATPTTAPQKTSVKAATQEIDASKLTEAQVAELIKQSVKQYTG